MTATALADKPVAPHRVNPLHGRDFRLLWTGQAISSLGDQFALVALP